jgi:anti-sigma factor RsiW
VIRDHSQEHLSAELIQAFLEGALPKRERVRAEEHLAGCARCAGEVEAWRNLFAELGELPLLRPHEGFADRVMVGVRIPEALPVAARVRQAIRSWMPGAAHPGHVPGTRLQDFVEGVLPGRQAARVQLHLDDCRSCSAEAHQWRGVLASLQGLERFAPAEGFAARVMDQVRLPATVAAPAPSREILVAARRAFASAGRLVPRSRQAWATLSGIAVTPMVTIGLVLYSVFSHPTLTPGALLSFVGWKATAFATMAWEATSAALLQSAGLFKLYSILDALVAAPAALAGGFIVFSCLMAGATWVLYKNLIATPSVDGRYARAST